MKALATLQAEIVRTLSVWVCLTRALGVRVFLMSISWQPVSVVWVRLLLRVCRSRIGMREIVGCWLVMFAWVSLWGLNWWWLLIEGSMRTLVLASMVCVMMVNLLVEAGGSVRI